MPGMRKKVRTYLVNAHRDPRHLKRVKRMKTFFSKSFKTTLVTEADEIIKEYAPDWPIDQINKIDLAILRNAVLELMQQKTPPKVVVNEAVEIAKLYGTESSPKFINGVLATVIEKKKDLWTEKIS